ncbi:MAG: hypothetical protein HY515_01205 [Candidatus Aenigmarchaeota archaeon]|nr:hypothetical protein [Candidatus Aenigmarchaeota archaeon]
MAWADIFLSLGFSGFYTLWAFVVGAIAVFGSFNKGLIRNFVMSWIFGIFLVSLSPIGSVVLAAFIRLFTLGISKLTKAEINHMFVFEDMKKTKSNKVLWVFLPFVILAGLYIVAAIFSPPLEVGWYKMNDVPLTELTSEPSSTVSEITWEDVKGMRLVSQEYALQIPKTLITETGWKLSDRWDGVYPINGTLYWVSSYEPATLINSGNPSPAYVLISGQDPSDRKKIYENIEYSEERGRITEIIYQIWTGKIRDTNVIAWLKYPFFEFGDPILTHNGKGPVWIKPAKLDFPTMFLIKFYKEQVGVVAIENDGNINFYSSEQIRSGSAPSWLENQILIDEDYSELRVYNWAKYKYWNNFLNYYFQHENVFEIAQDLYFQYDKQNERNYAVIQLEPEGRERKSITHFIEIESSGKNFGNVTIYDSRKLELIGPERALDDVRGEVSIYKNWYPLQPLFKKIRDGYFYVVPVYSGDFESMVLRGVAVVDAKREQVKLFKWAEVPEEIDVTQVETEQTDSLKGCTIISTQKAGNKLLITMECS